MWRRAIRQVVVVSLVVGQLGCRSVYRFECTSSPTEAGVVVEEQMLGETPCTVEIPKDSDLIRDGKIAFVFCLPDGREKTKVVDLCGLKPSKPLAEIVSAPFTLVGFVLVAPFLLASADDEDDEDDEHPDIGITLLGFGVMGIGYGVYCLCGGDLDAAKPRLVYVDFSAPDNVNTPASDGDQPMESGRE